MKNLTLLLIVFLIAITQFSCSDHEDFKAGNGSATFSMSPLARGKNGGRSEQTETPAAVLLSIEDSNGNVVVQNKKLSLFSFGQGYVSESLELSVGSYKLTQFLVLNANDTIIYAAPMAGSVLAQYVTNPLPISFNISKDASTQVVPQILAVSHTDTPESFGYVSFGFEVVTSKRRLSEVIVHTYDPLRIKYTYNNLNQLSKVEIFGLSEVNPSVQFSCFYNQEKLIKTVRYQVGDPSSDTTNYEYDLQGYLVHVAGHYDQKLFYQNGKPSEMTLKPGYYSHHEKSTYTYDSDGNISMITIYGYDEFDKKIWTSTEKYTYDLNMVMSGAFQSNLFHLASSYILSGLDYFGGISLSHNIVSLELSSQLESMSSPQIHFLKSMFEYDALGYPINETISTNLNAYYPEDGTIKEFFYESY